MSQLASPLPASAANAVVEHPLDPLTPDEITAAAAIVRAAHGLPASARFAAIRLHEPPKDVVRSFTPATHVERRAWVAVMDAPAGLLHDGVVRLDLDPGIEEWTERSGLQAPLLLDEYERAAEVIRNDPRWRAAVARRGVEDVAKIRIDPWMIGNFGGEEQDGRRMCASLSYLAEDRLDLPYARPIEGVVAYVDLNAMQVTKVLDPDPIPIPEDPGRYDAASLEPLRQGPKPIEITQPDGPRV